MHRLFVALRPPREIRDTLSATMTGVPGARWQDDSRLHLTLRYIGEVERPVAETAAALLAVRAPAPRVALAGVGRFDRRARTEALWAAVSPHDALAALHRKIDHALVRVGLKPEGRAYLPHFTIARLSRGVGSEAQIARWLADHASLSSAQFALPYLILYESFLGRGGARYEAVARQPLTA